MRHFLNTIDLIIEDGTNRHVMSRSTLREIFDNAASCISVKDVQGRFVYVNRALSNLLGNRAEDILGRTDADFFAEDYAKKFIRDDQKVMQTGTMVSYDEHLFPSDRSRVIVHTVKMALRNASGHVVGVLGIRSEQDVAARSGAMVLGTIPNQSGLVDDSWGDYSALTAYLSSRSFLQSADSLGELLAATIDSHEVFSGQQIADSRIIAALEITSPSLRIIKELQRHQLDFDDLNWRQFEELVAQMLELDGYEVKLQPGRKDGGIDILAWRCLPRIGQIFSVWQAKHLRTGRVSLRIVRELADSTNEFGASKGIIVTSSFLTKDALARVNRDKYILGKVDRLDLAQWVENL